jgi:hypothetical protein
MLHDCAALFALGAAADLVSVQDQVTSGVVQKTEDWSDFLFGMAKIVANRHSDRFKRVANDAVHAADPRFAMTLPRRACGQGECVCQFGVVDERSPA